MTQLQKALYYMELNPSLSFHHVAIKFGVNVSELQKAFQEQRMKAKVHEAKH